MAIDLDLVTKINERAIRTASQDITRGFERASKDAGESINKNIADGMRKAAQGTDKSALDMQRSINKVEQATGRLRLEQEKYDQLVSSGESNRVKLIQQAERLATARRAEEEATRRAALAYQDYGRSGGSASSSFLDGLRNGLTGARDIGSQAADGFGDGFAGAASVARLGASTGPIGASLMALVAVGYAAGKLIAPAIQEGMAITATKDMFQAGMGLDEASMTQYGAAAGGAFAHGWGESLADNLATAQSALQAGLINPDTNQGLVQQTIEQVQSAASITGASVEELTRSMTTLIRTGFAQNSQQALDIVVSGFQQGLDVSKDWLDTINEYSTQFRKLGLDAKDFAGLLKQGLEGGARDTDKVADSLKEFSIRAVDGSKLTREGFQALGLDADDMGRRFAAGGETARQAFGVVLQALRETGDAQQQALIWQALFGTQWEDMGDAINRLDLATAKTKFEDLQGTSDRATKTATDNFTSQWRTATNTVGQWFDNLQTKISDWFVNLPLIKDLPGLITEAFDPNSQQRDNTGNLPSSPIPRDPNALGDRPAAGQPDWTSLFGVPAPGAPAGGNGLPGPLGQLPAGGAPLPGATTAPPVPGQRTPMQTDQQQQAAKDAAANVDPSKYSLDSIPIGGFQGLSAGAMPSMPGPIAAPGQTVWNPQQGGYGAYEVDQQKIFDAQTALISQRQSVEDARMRLLQVEADNTSTQAQINAAKTAVITAERGYMSDQQKLAEAQQGTWKKMSDTAKNFTDGMGQIGAALDSDFGLSKGIPGIVENLTKLGLNFALAPVLGQLAGVQMRNGFAPGAAGSGIFGMLAGTGALGSQYLVPPGSAPGYGAPGAALPGYGSPAAPGGYAGDAALLANVPVGKYAQTQNADLTKGLADCSSAVEDLVNILDGRPTGGREMSTHNAAQWLTDHGFLAGMGGPGDFRVGYNSGHMQATLPGGTNFNWGSDAAAAQRGMDGSAGAYDPAFTSHYYRPAAGSSAAPAMPSAGPAPTPSALGPAALQPPLNPSAPLPNSVIYNPANTNPALTGPDPSLPAPGSFPGGGGGPGGPLGNMPSGLMPGGAVPNSQLGSQSFNNPVGGEGFQGLGGLPMAAISSAIGAAGAGGSMFGGQAAAAAAQLGMQLANRAIAFGGQAAGIGVSGLMETLLPSGNSADSSISNSWLGRAVGGFSGAKLAVPNVAGQAAPPQQPQDGQNPNQQPGQDQNNLGKRVGVNIENYNVQQNEDRAGQDLARHQGDSVLAGAGKPRGW